MVLPVESSSFSLLEGSELATAVRKGREGGEGEGGGVGGGRGGGRGEEGEDCYQYYPPSQWECLPPLEGGVWLSSERLCLPPTPDT